MCSCGYMIVTFMSNMYLVEFKPNNKNSINYYSLISKHTHTFIYIYVYDTINQKHSKPLKWYNLMYRMQN